MLSPFPSMLCLQSQYGKGISKKIYINFSKHSQQQAPIQNTYNCINRTLYLTEDHLAAASLGSRQLLAKAVGQSQALKATSSKGKRVHVCICLCYHPRACHSKPYRCVLNLCTTPVSFLCAELSEKAENMQNAI